MIEITIPDFARRHVVTDGSCYVLCAVEGCDRNQPGAGQESWCGLAKIGAPVSPKDMTCGAGATVEHWFDFERDESGVEVMQDRPCPTRDRELQK